MINFLFYKKSHFILKKFVCFILVVSFIAPSVFFIHSPRVKAELIGAVAVVGGNGTWQQTLSAAANAVTSKTSSWIAFKEGVLDPIAWGVANLMIHEMSRSIIQWINSGFEGNPAFVTDFGGFLRDVADDEIGRFIEGSALAFLCDPLDIKFSLALRYSVSFEKEVECTLSDVVDNIDAFIAGDFGRGGWDGWIELTTRPNNNRYGAYLASAAELDARIQFSQFEKGKVIEFGRGFYSWEECEEHPTNPEDLNCQIVTPGSVIEKQLNNTLDNSQRRLQIADEFNEIVGALISQLLVQAITSVRGLKGVSDRGNRSSSYLDRIRNERSGISESAFRNLKDKTLAEFNRAVKNETAYLTAKQKSLDSVVTAENKLVELEACYAGKLADSNLSLTSAEIAIAQERMDNASSTQATRTIPLKNEFTNEVTVSDSNLTTLILLRNTVEEATSETDLSTPANRLSEMIINGTIHNETDVVSAEQRRDDVVSEMDTLRQDTDAKIIECNAFPPPPTPIT